MQVYPRFYVENGDGPQPYRSGSISKASWPFTYSGIHAEALRHASDRFVPKTWPPYVLWWVADDHRPDWHEAIARFELLHDRGPTADAFDFKSPSAPTSKRASVRTRSKSQADEPAPP